MYLLKLQLFLIKTLIVKQILLGEIFGKIGEVFSLLFTVILIAGSAREIDSFLRTDVQCVNGAPLTQQRALCRGACRTH